MAFSRAKSPHYHLLPFLTLLSLFFISHAMLTLDRSDLKALSTIVKDLGIGGQRFYATNPCSAAGVFCERRLTENNTYVLKVTRLVFKSQGLDGFLSPAIGKLSELKELSVSHNNIVDQLQIRIIGLNWINLNKKTYTPDLKQDTRSGQNTISTVIYYLNEDLLLNCL